MTCGYATDPLIFPKSPSKIPEEAYAKCSKVKDKITPELAKKHYNVSTICVDYRIKRNELVDGEICLQIGVLTKGLVPLGEECLPEEIKGIPVDVIESNVRFCVQSDLRVYPVNLGVGIGVEGDGDSTGSLGAVVKLNKQPTELFILSNAHVLYREGAKPLSITQPSPQDYETKLNTIGRSIKEHRKEVENLEKIIRRRQHSGDSVQIQKKELVRKTT